MKMVFWGYNNYGEFILDYFQKKGYIIPLIITPSSDAEKISRIKNITGNKSRIISISESFSGEIIKSIEQINPDVMLSCSFKYKIPDELLIINKKKIINIHGALLPEFRGANMLNWVLIKGCQTTGITLHYMENTLDSGDILAQISYPIYFEDDAVSLKKRMFEKTLELFDNSWNNIISGKALPQKQDHSKAHYYPARKPEDGLINWKLNAIDVYNLSRALVSPFPGAFSFYNGMKYIFEKIEIYNDNQVHFKSGKIIEVTSEYMLVSTLYNLVKVLKIYKATPNRTETSFKVFKPNTFFTNA